MGITPIIQIGEVKDYTMLAWLVGMPIIFWAIDAAQKLDGVFRLITFIAGVLFLVGLVVGAIYGIFLTRLANIEAS